jgi:hypothetical protein
MRIEPIFAVVLFAPLGCTAYEHEVDVEVRDPRAVWIESPHTNARADPQGPGQRAIVPGTRVVVTRDGDGALSVNGRTVVGHDGVVSPPDSLSDATRDGGMLRTSACYRLKRKSNDCSKSVWITTPMSNVKTLAERDAPLPWLGYVELFGGLALGGTGYVLADQSPQYRGAGAIMMGVGAAAAIIGVVQLFSGAHNERTIVDDNE